MTNVSIIIPSRSDYPNGERFLQPTVTDLLSKGTDIEVIVVLDGYWPDPPLIGDNRLHIIHRGKAMGMRAAINAAAAVATGKYLMKCDAHCMFGEGYDKILSENCDGDWIVIPRRYSLDAENWKRNEEKTPIDYEYLRYAYYKPDEVGIHGTIWPERGRTRIDIPIDEDMSFQGSCWFMPAKHFAWMGGMQEEGYGTFIGEPQEIGLKTWLGGGKTMVNKLTWYAHLHKGKQYGRGYSMPKSELVAGNLYSVDTWMHNKWERRIHDLSWLIERFWPVPTWPEDRSLWTL
jgi:glycosyltransferase involved in cell wall biosynthesis